MPWLASISLDVAVGGDVVQDPAQDIFIISKNHHCTKPTVILNFSTPSVSGVAHCMVNSLTPIDGHDRQFFNELLCSLVTSPIFVRC